MLDDNVGTATSYTLSANSGSAYKFRVIAINTVGESLSSPESAIIIAANAPDPPTNLARVYADGTMITIEWDAPLLTGGIPVIDYKVYWDYGQGGQLVEIASTTANDRLFTQDSDIIGGRTYAFTAVAVNAVDESVQSAPLLVIAARVPTTPDAPIKQSADGS